MKIRFVQHCDVTFYDENLPVPEVPCSKFYSIGDELVVSTIRTFQNFGLSEIRHINGMMSCIPTMMFEVIN